MEDLADGLLLKKETKSDDPCENCEGCPSPKSGTLFICSIN